MREGELQSKCLYESVDVVSPGQVPTDVVSEECEASDSLHRISMMVIATSPTL